MAKLLFGENVFRPIKHSLNVKLFVVYVSLTDVLQVSEKKARDWCASRGNIPYFETSAKEDINVDGAFLCIAKAALANEREQDM